MSNRAKISAFAISITLILTILSFGVIKPPPSSAVDTNSTRETKYYLKDYNGMLAIFEGDRTIPLEVLKVSISSLPERDIEKIKKGIFADSLNEIISLAEDYE